MIISHVNVSPRPTPPADQDNAERNLHRAPPGRLPIPNRAPIGGRCPAACLEVGTPQQWSIYTDSQPRAAARGASLCVEAAPVLGSGGARVRSATPTTTARPAVMNTELWCSALSGSPRASSPSTATPKGTYTLGMRAAPPGYSPVTFARFTNRIPSIKASQQNQEVYFKPHTRVNTYNTQK